MFSTYSIGVLQYVPLINEPNVENGSLRGLDEL